MNIFAEKGIRDVADVTLYSINRIGTEEFYLPVLYLDSLKLTNFSKSVATNENFGGIGNRKTVSWSYTKDIKLKVEDALFTQASLSMLVAGQLAQKMSPWTSAIAKLMVANKYGRNSYSTKAYPSPQLTDEEWEIVFRCAQKAVFDPRPVKDDTVANPTKYLYSEHEEDNESVAENRWLLQKRYMQRDQVEEIDIAPYMDIAEGVEGLSVIVKMTEQDREAAKQFFDNFIKQSDIGDTEPMPMEGLQIKICSSDSIINTISCNLMMLFKHDYNGSKIDFAYLVYPPDPDLPLFSNAYNVDDEVFVAPIGNENFYNDFLRLLMSPYSKPLAMPQKIIDLISDEVRDNKNFGYQSNCLKEVKKIDHFEQYTVTDPNGLKIDIVEQNENIRKMYRNDIDNYTVYYDEKTMMPFAESTPLNETIKNQKAILVSRLDYPSGIDYENAKKNKFIDKIKPYLLETYGIAAENWINSLTPEDIIVIKTATPAPVDTYILQYFLITKRQYFTLKYGTTYYKKTRVIDTDDNDITFLGIDVPIDYDTFSGEYMIVGKTEVKDQATGKDSPCQIIFNRTAISSSTTLNLSGKGEPATFSFDVAILDPIDENKNAVELIFYKTEKDEREGGERIIPQSKRYARTPILQTKEEVVAANEEMY